MSIETIKVKRYALYVTKTNPRMVSEVLEPKRFDSRTHAFSYLLHELTYFLSPQRDDGDQWPAVKVDKWADRTDDFDDAIVAWEVWGECDNSIFLTIYEEEKEYKIDTSKLDEHDF